MQKRIVSLLLVLVMLVSLFPAPVRATETDSNVDSGMTVEGTNGFGNLLSAEIQAEYEAETQDTGNYSVLGLEITGNTATVEYASMEEAVLVVALYTEDGLQLLTSGKTTVDPTEDIATVTIEGNMPEYFQASAYLADTYDFSPLCASYDTPMYTREMQELLASTVEDYDADRVLQLDEDKTTNFAVYAEDTIVIEEQPGVNTVTSVNDATSTYVIENADESITSLREGDIFAYPYGDNEILIVKVASITVDGTTATIAGAEMEMEEAFSHVKIEVSGDTSDAEYQDGSAEEGVSFDGLVTEGGMARAIEGDTSASETLKYTLDKKLKADGSHAEASVTVKGTLSLEYKLEFSYYVSFKRQFFEVETKVGVKSDISVGGKVAGKIGLGSFGFSPVAGVYIDFSPELKLEFSGKIAYNVTLSTSASVTYGNEKGFDFHFSKPAVESKLEVEGTIFLGVDFNPNIGVVGGTVLDAVLSLPVGVKLEAKQAGTAIAEELSGDSIHGCEKCLDMELKFEAEAEAKLKFLNWEKLTLEKKVDFKIKIGNMYYSFDDSAFGWGKCPAVDYLVTVQTQKADRTVAGNVVVTVDGERVGNTNANGVLLFYLSGGAHRFSAIIEGKTCQCSSAISAATKVVLREDGSFASNGGNSSGGGGFRDQVAGNVTDIGAAIAGGACGDNLTWELTGDGTLFIFGTGEMADCGGVMPWNDHLTSITKVVICEGVTSIGNQAFSRCENLRSIDLPETLISLGEGAFKSCFDLSSIIIPQGVTSIGAATFYSCGSLASVDIPDGVAAIGDQAFYNCTGLKKITIPGSVASIGASAFSTCRNMTSVVIREGVATIGSQAFVNCNSLASMVIPGSVTSIEWGAFNSCNKLKNIYFGGSKDQWNQLGTGISTTSATIHFNSTGPVAAAESLSTETATEDIPALDAIFGGAYDTEELENYTLKTASFTGLVPGEEYLLLALKNLEAEDTLAADNLLYIDQAAAGEDGTLSFEYIQRTPATVSYVMACGPSNKNLNDAIITFPEMEADGEVQAVDPTVTYEGKELTEGVDYTLLGDVSFTAAGDYTCYIRGIHSYTGLVECSYTVTDKSEVPPVEETEPSAPPTEETKPTTPPTEDEKPTTPPAEETKPTTPPSEDDKPMENPFVDVFEADYYYTPVLWAVNKGVTTGMTATTFEPTGTCTRAQIVTFLWRANGSPAAGGANPFTDVPVDAWYTDAVLWAVEKGITTGTSATTFSPDAGCTRGQVATFLWRSQGQPASGGDNIFTDIAPGAYYYDAVLWAVANGITNGMGEGLFAPDATCTRGQIVTFLYRAMA